MKKYNIYYCYGGPFKGACKMIKEVEAVDENKAVETFISLWNYEEIYSVTEVIPSNLNNQTN